MGSSIKKYKIENFYRGLLNEYEYDSIDYATNQLKALQGLSVAENIIIQEADSGMLYKSRPFKFLGTSRSQYSRLIPFEIEAGFNNIGQVFCLTGNSQTKVINLNNEDISLASSVTQVPYQPSQLSDIDYEFINGVLILAHKDVVPQCSFYDANNPSLTPIQYNSNNTVATSPSYYGLWRGFEQIDQNLKVQILPGSPSVLQLLNNKYYKFQVGDYMRCIYVVKPGALQNLEVYIYLMDLQITSISNGGDSAEYTVINGTDDFNPLIQSGAIPSPGDNGQTQGNVIVIPQINHDNVFFSQQGFSIYPSAVTISNDQRLIFQLANNIYGSEVGNFFNFYKTSTPALNLPFQFAEFQKVINPGTRLGSLNEKLFVFSGSQLTQYDYTDSAAANIAPEATSDISFKNIKPKPIDMYLIAVHSSGRSLRFTYYVHNVDIIKTKKVFEFESDILDGNIIDVVVQKNPVARVWMLLDSGNILIFNAEAGADFEAKPHGITKLTHPNGKFIAITSLNFVQVSPNKIIVSVLDTITNNISYELYDEPQQQNLEANTEDVFLDRIVRQLNVDPTTFTYVKEQYNFNLYGTGNTDLDGNIVSLVIKSIDNSKEIREDNFTVLNGSINISREIFNNFTGLVNIYVGTQYKSMFGIVPFDVYRQGEMDMTNDAVGKAIDRGYLVCHRTTKFANNNNNVSGATMAVQKYESDNVTLTYKESQQELTSRTLFNNINFKNNNLDEVNKMFVFSNDDHKFFSIRGLGFDYTILT